MFFTVDEQERIAYFSGTPIPDDLLDLAQAGESFMEIQDVGDISAGFPEEGFLDGLLTEIDTLIQETHKNNKVIPSLIRIRESLAEKADEVIRNGEYGQEELNKLEIRLGL